MDREDGKNMEKKITNKNEHTKKAIAKNGKIILNWTKDLSTNT